MRLARLSVLFLASVALGCNKAPETPVPPKEAPKVSPAPSEKAENPKVEPAPATPAPATPAAPEVILPATDPAPEPKADPAKPQSSTSAASSPYAFVAAKDAWGSLTGRFIYDGTPAVPDKLKVDKDLECCGKYLDEIVDESLTVGEGNGIADIFIYVTSKNVDVHPDVEKGMAAEVIMDHDRCRYAPHAIAVWAGKQKVKFGNKDPINHAVKFDSFKNGSANQTLAQNTVFEYTFQAAEKIPMPVTCGIHPWEKGLLLVRDNPYFAVTGKDGTFKIDNLPAGKLKFQVWQERSGYLVAKPDWKRGEFEVEIKAGENNLGDIKVPAKVLEKKG